MMTIMRRKVVSPTLSTKSQMSPQVNWRVDGSPYFDLCPPTPPWDTLPSVQSVAQSPTVDHSADLQIAWSTYQNCSRRMNNACVANREQSLEEQRIWWEETSSACRNAILLHNATLCKQPNAETAKNLAILENAHHIVLTMLESLSSRQEAPIEQLSADTSLSIPMATTPTLFDEDPEPVKRSRLLGLTIMFGKMRNHLITKDSKVEVDKMNDMEAMLY